MNGLLSAPSSPKPPLIGARLGDPVCVVSKRGLDGEFHPIRVFYPYVRPRGSRVWPKPRPLPAVPFKPSVEELV